MNNVKLLHLAQRDDVDGLKAVETELSTEASGRGLYEVCYEKSGDTLAHVAARSGSVRVLRYLLEDLKSIQLLECANLDGKRPLHEAAQASQPEALKLLLHLGAQVDSLKRADWTPLMLACTKSDLVTIQLLIRAGASVALKNKDGWTPFHIACREGHYDIILYLLNTFPDAWKNCSTNGRTPLHTAALHRHLNCVELLCTNCGYEPDEVDSCGTTPFMDAARVDDIQVMDCISNHHDIDILKADIVGRNSLHLAAQAGALSAIDHLITRYRLDVNTLTTTKQNALHLAAKEGQEAAISLLLQLGCNARQMDHKGRKAADVARAVNHNSCADILSKAEMDNAFVK
ncbi:ankyrin repeat domain-containing protein 16-like isoform X1 [Ornithodoros turicata]|uniref:ankyrin repeat domain-containing protein 16-like isoform X1 n=1 Tax=Ornithodoros turicata TaxID=34597 RepID=UPI003138BD2A